MPLLATTSSNEPFFCSSHFRLKRPRLRLGIVGAISDPITQRESLQLHLRGEQNVPDAQTKSKNADVTKVSFQEIPPRIHPPGSEGAENGKARLDRRCVLIAKIGRILPYYLHND